MNLLERVERASSALKVFPLPSAVLFPHAVLPLHIFEPRYREMVRDALAGDQVIAMAGLAPGWERDYGGRPHLLPVVCAGVIVWHEALPDGRYNLLLQGTVRARVLEELPPTHAYREVRSEVVADPTYMGPETELLRQAVLELAGRLPPAVLEPLLQMAARLEGGALADVVASALVQEPEQRLELLEELDVGARMRGVLAEVSELMMRLGPPVPAGLLN
jgi:Lon protease-like protein